MAGEVEVGALACCVGLRSRKIERKHREIQKIRHPKKKEKGGCTKHAVFWPLFTACHDLKRTLRGH